MHLRRGEPFWKLMGWNSGRGLSWTRGTRVGKESLAPACAKHQGSCFDLSFLATLSVASAARGHGFCRHQSVDGSPVTCSSCSSSRSELSSCPLSTAPSSLLTDVPLFSLCVKFLSNLPCNCFLSGFPFLPFPQPQMPGLDIRIPCRLLLGYTESAYYEVLWPAFSRPPS